MSKLKALAPKILECGVDGRICEADVAAIRQALPADETIDREDLEFLAELRSRARSVCPAFDQFFFPALKRQILADGRVSLVEQFHLLRMLYGGGGVDNAEKQFLRELRREIRETTPEFEALCDQAMSA
jgi:hypothetical protein